MGTVAVYGIDFFGVGRFGRDPSVVRPDFSVEPFVTTPLDYSTLHLTWMRPQSPDCTYLRLVRMYRNLSQYGGQPPGATEDDQAQADGVVVFTDVVTRPAAYTDTGLGSGFVYYTMWGWSDSTSTWIHCSDVIGLVPINWGYGWRYYNLLPAAYRDRDIVLVDPYNPWPVSGDPLPPLQRFLQLIGFQTDFIRTEMESLMSINDPANCSGALLPLMAQQLGLPHEPEIGMQQERELIQNAIHLYKYKGSPRGLTEFCSILTGYPATTLVHHGYNCLLTLDDGIMADGIGTWQPWPPAGTNFPTIANSNRGLSLNYNPNVMTGPDPVSGMTDPVQEIYPNVSFGPPAYTSSVLEVSASGADILSAENASFEGGTTGNWAAGANCAIANQAVPGGTQGATGLRCMSITPTRANTIGIATLAGQSVSGNTSYLINANFLSTGVNRQCQVALQWFNGATSLGTVSSQQFIEVNNQWTTISLTATSPATANAVTISLNILNPNNGEMHYVDNVQLGAGGADVYFTTGPIPITDFMSQWYAGGHATFRFQIWSNTGPRQVELSLWGDNGSGTPVQILAPQTFTERLNHWQLMTLTGAINPYPGSLPGDVKPIGPAAYYWIYPRIRILGIGTGTHYITLAGLWPCALDQIGVETPAYDYPRDVKVVLQPQSSNLLSNTLTTFTRTNPSPPPAMLNMGFDGLTAAPDPLHPTTGLTGTMSIRQQTLEDAPGAIAVYGTSALEMDVTQAGGTVWFGQVQNWSAPPTLSAGWWVPVSPKPTADWFTGGVIGAAAHRPWVDPDDGTGTVINSWFTMDQPWPNYFGIGTAVVGGIWFNLPPQPPQHGNLVMFNVQNAQPFNFSVYAKYLNAQDPTMILGFRWIYADGTYVENGDTTYEVTLTQDYQRYSIAPASPPAPDESYLGLPPPEASPPTGQYPIGVFPFVRFPSAQTASFLLNAAMLSPTSTVPTQYMDSTSMSAATGEFLQDPVSGASYYYQRRTPRIARLNAELYRWLPMGSTYTIQYMSGAIAPPLDPTIWPRLHVLMGPSTTLTATPN